MKKEKENGKQKQEKRKEGKVGKKRRKRNKKRRRMQGRSSGFLFVTKQLFSCRDCSKQELSSCPFSFPVSRLSSAHHFVFLKLALLCAKFSLLQLLSSEWDKNQALNRELGRFQRQRSFLGSSIVRSSLCRLFVFLFDENQIPVFPFLVLRSSIT